MRSETRRNATRRVAPPQIQYRPPRWLLSRNYNVRGVFFRWEFEHKAPLHAGVKIVRDHPVTGVGPNMILHVYPKYRDADAVEKQEPHLHNVVLQIAAERGLPALGLWLWFIVSVAVSAVARFRTAPRHGTGRFLAASAIACIVAMLGAGMFEHNFGDSEFLMLFLVLITLPFAVTRTKLLEPVLGP